LIGLGSGNNPSEIGVLRHPGVSLALGIAFQTPLLLVLLLLFAGLFSSAFFQIVVLASVGCDRLNRLSE